MGWRAEGPNKRCCWKCHANKGSIPFADNSLTAAWRKTVIPHSAYLTSALLTGGFISCVFNLPGFDLSYIVVDLMHTADLGVTQYVLGNVLWEVFQEMGGSREHDKEAIRDILMLIKTASRQLKQKDPPINSLTLNMIRVRINLT